MTHIRTAGWSKSGLSAARAGSHLSNDGINLVLRHQLIFSQPTTTDSILVHHIRGLSHSIWGVSRGTSSIFCEAHTRLTTGGDPPPASTRYYPISFPLLPPRSRIVSQTVRGRAPASNVNRARGASVSLDGDVWADAVTTVGVGVMGWTVRAANCA
jgi:hypothetical protein